MQQQTIVVFRELPLEASSGVTTLVASTVSGLIPINGNFLVFAAQVINSSNLLSTSSPALTVVVEGTVDGVACKPVITRALSGSADIASGEPLYFEGPANAGASWSNPFARVRVTLAAPASGIARILLNLSLGVSAQ